MDYKSAGVDISAGDAFVEAIVPIAKATARPGVMDGLGGFAALFDPKAAGFTDPIIVTGTDGVGTKLRLAIETGYHDTIGIDLVAMCVNDIVTHGATPSLFLDYYATGNLDPAVAIAVVRGIALGCTMAGCSLVGGETAEMPGVYPIGDYDLAGFAIGLVERHRMLPSNVQAGDVLIGLPSSGVHANGFSLIRQIFAPVSWNDRIDTRTLGQTFLTPTRIYVREVLSLLPLLHAAAHITGGGLIGNLPRVLPAGLAGAVFEPWQVPSEFGWLRRSGDVSRDEMLHTFNCGIGMVLVVAKDVVDLVRRSQPDAIVLGEVIIAPETQIALPPDSWWL